MDTLIEKAKNYYILGVIAEKLNMYSESASNYFKALFALDDSLLKEKFGLYPKDHSERFSYLELA